MKKNKIYRQYIDTGEGYTIEEYRLMLALKYADYKNYDIARDVAEKVINNINPAYSKERQNKISILYKKVIQKIEKK